MPRASIVGLLLVGCVPAVPPDPNDADDAAIVIEDPSDDAAETSAVPEQHHPKVDLPGAPPTLVAFVERFAVALVDRNVPALLDFFSAQNREAQRGIGIDDDQYVAEGIGLSEYRRLDPGPRDRVPAHALNLDSIEEVVADTAEQDGDCYEVGGQIGLSDGRRYQLDLRICPAGTTWEIVPAVG